MASLLNKPLTSLCTNKSDIRSPEFFTSKRCRVGVGKSGHSVGIASTGVLSRKNGGCVGGTVCKAVSVAAETEVEGLNIADDVTQVRLLLALYLFSDEEMLMACLD